MFFAQIPGLAETKQSLIKAVHNNHIAHAQLFVGSDGSANLAMALAFATYINCEDKLATDSCGKCVSCNKYNKLIHPDLHFVFPVSTTKSVSKDPMSTLFMKEWRSFIAENPFGDVNTWANHIDAENKQLNISVEEARNIVKTISMKAFEAEYKVLIIWLAENMHPSASNAILKVLEEPPVKTVFLLVTNNSERIITTILSRTQRVKIRAFRDEEIKSELVNKHGIEERKAQQLAYLAHGNMNHGLQLVNEVEEDSHEMFRTWMRHCFKRNNVADLISAGEDFQKKGREGQKSLFLYGLHMMRECLIFPYSRELIRLQQEEFQFVEGFSKIANGQKVEAISKQLTEACYHIERNGNAKIIFLDTSLNISSILKSKDVHEKG